MQFEVAELIFDSMPGIISSLEPDYVVGIFGEVIN